jgi:hypothetical protein
MNKKYITCATCFVLILIETATILFYEMFLNNSSLSVGNQTTNINETYKIFEEKQWIFNFDISQYKTIMFKEINRNGSKDLVVFESLVLFNQENDIINHLSCLFNIDSKLVFQNQVQIVDINKNNFFLVNCKLETNSSNTKLNLNYISLAIIDRRKFEKFKNETKNIITFKRPLLVKNNKEDTNLNKAIVNCVHMTRCWDNCLDFRKKINSWSEILQKIGYNKIQLYVFNASQSFQDDLVKNDNIRIIELIDYESSSENLCEWHKLQFDRKQTDINKMLLLNCINSVKKFFSITNDWWFGLHEKINTNACYLQHKYTHEFITNLDLDEIIFSHLYNSNLIGSILNKSISSFLKNSDLVKYDLYDFTKKLIKEKGENIAYFLFPHTLSFTNHKEFLNLVQNFNMNNPQLCFTKSSQCFLIDKNEAKDCLLEKKEFAHLAEKENQKYTTNTVIHEKFYNSIILNCPYRLGKSIYVTKNTITINQHQADNLRDGTYERVLRFEEGYFVGHFRDDPSICLPNIKKPINYLKFDLEYFMFIVKSFKKLII